MSVGLHSVTVSEDRAADAWGSPVNANPYFTTDASGWTGGTWAAGSVTVLDGFQLTQSAYTPNTGQGIRARAVVIIPQGPNGSCTLWFHFQTTGAGLGRSRTFNLTPGRHTVAFDLAQSPAQAASPVRLALTTGNSLSVTVESYELSFNRGSGFVPVDLSCLADEITIHHGREDPSGQPEASTCSVDLSWNAQQDTLPPELEIGAVVRVTTRFPVVWERYAWVGTPDASRSTKTIDPDAWTNWAENPEFRADALRWSGATGSSRTWQTTGGYDGGPYGRAVTDGTLVANGSLWGTPSGPVVNAGQDAVYDFWARAVGGLTTGRVQYLSTGQDITLGPEWQHYTGRVRIPTTGTNTSRLTAGSGVQATAGQGIDLDHALFTFVNAGAPAPAYFDGSTPNVGEEFTRFSGRVTDIDLGWEDTKQFTPDTQSAQVICAGFSADLGRQVVGDAPFPQELDGPRVSRVFGLAGVILDPLQSDPGTVQILPRDIDSQPALDVAQDTAVSANGVIWYTRDGQVRYADANHRGNTGVSLALDSCDILVSPAWMRNLEGLVNKISLGYGATPDGGEQPRYLASNAASVAKYGTYSYTTATELATLADAQALAGLLIARQSEPVWVMTALPVDVTDLDDDRYAALLGLDMHSLIELTGLPAIGGAPTSAALFVEGWTERLAWAEHEVSLFVSGYCRTAPPPTWDELDATRTWDNTDPALTWDAVACLGPKVSQGRWMDVPATSRWQATDPAITWDTWKD